MGRRCARTEFPVGASGNGPTKDSVSVLYRRTASVVWARERAQRWWATHCTRRSGVTLLLRASRVNCPFRWGARRRTLPVFAYFVPSSDTTRGDW